MFMSLVGPCKYICQINPGPTRMLIFFTFDAVFGVSFFLPYAIDVVMLRINFANSDTALNSSIING